MPEPHDGQGFGAQLVFGPSQSPWQLAWGVIVQLPPLQQAPVGGGCGQGLGEHVVPGPCQTLGGWQLA